MRFAPAPHPFPLGSRGACGPVVKPPTRATPAAERAFDCRGGLPGAGAVNKASKALSAAECCPPEYRAALGRWRSETADTCRARAGHAAHLGGVHKERAVNRQGHAQARGAEAERLSGEPAGAAATAAAAAAGNGRGRGERARGEVRFWRNNAARRDACARAWPCPCRACRSTWARASP